MAALVGDLVARLGPARKLLGTRALHRIRTELQRGEAIATRCFFTSVARTVESSGKQKGMAYDFGYSVALN